ncbi:restriction endonuclease [Variovorax boronicumulans]|uniref:Restriction endonuclease n=1 Tax=Variovorax boronicumulans TaxID=436515 RepID=A0A250DTS8_9BURK|nr:restriction endonuclease [Variovorax boronicumulans]
MPQAPPRPCTHQGCGRLVYDGSGRCVAHPRVNWAKKPEAVKRITGRRLQRLREQLFTRNPLCVRCQELGLTALATQRDHIVSLEEGGLDVEANTQGLCDLHHDEKSLAERLRARRRPG